MLVGSVFSVCVDFPLLSTVNSKNPNIISYLSKMSCCYHRYMLAFQRIHHRVLILCIIHQNVVTSGPKTRKNCLISCLEDFFNVHKNMDFLRKWLFQKNRTKKWKNARIQEFVCFHMQPKSALEKEIPLVTRSPGHNSVSAGHNCVSVGHNGIFVDTIVSILEPHYHVMLPSVVSH